MSQLTSEIRDVIKDTLHRTYVGKPKQIDAYTFAWVFNDGRGVEVRVTTYKPPKKETSQ